MADRDRHLGVRALQVALLVAGLASVAILVSLFDDLIRYICLAVIVVVAVLTAPERKQRGGGWWTILGIGALASVAGALIAEVAQTPGGLLAVVGGVLVVIACTIGFPLDDEED